jgi:TRAP-type transport system periplasmic protein
MGGTCSKASRVQRAFDPARRDALKQLTGLASSICAPTVLLSCSPTHRAQGTRRLKLAISLPRRHPISAGLQAAADDILNETGGGLEIAVFASGELGSDTDTISQTREGAIDFVSTAGLVWGTLVPVASIGVTAFAFPDYRTIWDAMDGELGAYIRDAFADVSLVPMTRIWDHGFRHITMADKAIVSPKDVVDQKIRVPMSPMLISLFRDLGAAPTSTNYADLYTALQTRIADGQENPLSLVDTGRIYEVQRFCSLTAHAWDGFWLCANKKSWTELPEEWREIAARRFDEHALKERAINAALNSTLEQSLKVRGLQFNSVNRRAFQQVLKEAEYYAQWKEKLGVQVWTLLERYSGILT